jgi:predicted nuclease with TOPRIM domain
LLHPAALQVEKVTLSRSLDDEKQKILALSKEKDELLKRNTELETEMANLGSLATSTNNEKKKAEGTTRSVLSFMN